MSNTHTFVRNIVKNYTEQRMQETKGDEKRILLFVFGHFGIRRYVHYAEHGNEAKY